MMKEYNKSIKGKLFKYFKERLNTKSSTKGYERCDCIFCGGKYTFGINIFSNRTHCFKCGTEMSPIQLLMEIQGFDKLNQAYNFLKVQQEYTAYDSMLKHVKVEEKQVILPESFSLISISNSKLGNAAQRYMRGRGFDLDELALRGVGYCTSGNYGGYIIFPFYVASVLRFFQGRRFTAYGTKMKNPNEEEFGIGKSKIVYNSDALFIYDEIDLVESITNALTLEENSVAILGKSASDHQISRIISSPCQKVNIILDPDAIDKAVDLGLKIVNFKDEIKLVELPKDKDVNDIGRKKTNKIKYSSPVLKYKDLIKLRNNVKEKSIDPHYSRPSSYSTFRGAR